MSAQPADGTVVVCKYQPELLAALLDRHADVCLVLDAVDRRYATLDQTLLARCRKVYGVGSFDSLPELAAVAVDVRSSCAVTRLFNQSELSQFGAGYLRLLLGLADDPLHHVAHRDKRLMKELVRATGVPTAEFRSLPDAAEQAAVASIAGALTAPLIVKPAAGFGATTTVRVDDVAELGAAANGLTFDTSQRSRQLIVEEYVTGDEFCVDAIWSGEKALTFVVHRYLRPRMTVLDNALDGSVILAPDEHTELYAGLRDMHALLNPALGIRDGLSHLEVFQRPDGELVFSEIATRAGGGWIQYMIGAHHGHSTWTLAAEAALTGTVPPLVPARSHIGGISVRPTTPGIIAGMPTDDELTAFPGMITWHRRRKVGERARLSGPSDWYLFLVLGGDSEDELVDRCMRAARTFTVRTEQAD
ncbi:MAG TPA: ATP-grasp domain-containing protein [Pseudonocardiaceae bacterium]|nr:ATP-grasp domain-containing protein [Pseudonocardiaceae bacterium]